MNNEKCRNFESCEAPLCPIDKQSMQHCIWYPDEAICRAKTFQTLDWVKKQKLIARKHGSVDHFFTLKMLKAISKVTKGIIGANPDLPLSAKADEAWIRNREVTRRGRITATTK